MYWWNIKELKQELRSKKIAEKDVFSYFLAYLILDALVLATWGLFPVENDLSVWDYIEAAGYFLIVVIGTAAFYVRNGGAKGKEFFVRYFPLVWVVGIRFLAVCVPILSCCSVLKRRAWPSGTWA